MTHSRPYFGRNMVVFFVLGTLNGGGGIRHWREWDDPHIPFPLFCYIYLHFHPLEVVSRYSDPQCQVLENYSYVFNLRPDIYKSSCLNISLGILKQSLWKLHRMFSSHP